ncbi:unnamed protein product [Gordionus sp. m RMFG-2023]|uniref:aspartate aminotransferase, cytoplasmic-like n=1 Tax=Gordionus sp. m RMFG-2023 TaxID=3053472 RepID=UPI0030E27ACA
MSQFLKVQPAPLIEVFHVNTAYHEDKNPQKVNLSVGAFRTDSCKPWILPVVKKAEEILAKEINEEIINHEYLPIKGLESFCHAATTLLLGKNDENILNKKAQGVQGISGTGSLKIALDFYKEVMGASVLYVPIPTWENHKLMGKNCHYAEIKEYRYWNAKEKNFDLEGMMQDLKEAPANSVVILHGCSHNPTGIDPTPEQWGSIIKLFQDPSHPLYLLFDIAYQGFASGDPDKDAYAVRLFASKGIEFFAAQSFAKNFGLYNERIGNLTVLTSSPETTKRVISQMVILIRGNYSNPPAHGAQIVEKVLNDQSLYQEWKECVKKMAERIISIRRDLKKSLDQNNTPGHWNHITDQIGMFSFTGLTPKQVQHLRDEWHIYMLNNGRISLCGLNKDNVEYVGKAICETLKIIPNEIYP